MSREIAFSSVEGLRMHRETLLRWLNGAKLQYRVANNTKWFDCESQPKFSEYEQYRVKPELRHVEKVIEIDGIKFGKISIVYTLDPDNGDVDIETSTFYSEYQT